MCRLIRSWSLNLEHEGQLGKKTFDDCISESKLYKKTFVRCIPLSNEKLYYDFFYFRPLLSNIT